MGVLHLIFGFLSLVCLTSAASICGTVGYHNETTLSFYMGNFFYSAPSTFTLCAAFCKTDTRCESFRYSSDSTNQFCEFFDASLSAYFTPDSTSPYYYYDIDCPFPPFGSASVISAVTTTSTPPASTSTGTTTTRAANPGTNCAATTATTSVLRFVTHLDSDSHNACAELHHSDSSQHPAYHHNNHLDEYLDDDSDNIRAKVRRGDSCAGSDDHANRTDNQHRDGDENRDGHQDRDCDQDRAHDDDGASLKCISTEFQSRVPPSLLRPPIHRPS
ncbi:hypothetical protein ST47_g9949 [Ascochyta rabiei]|uniref:Uncharacterized protein n=1 Tax=Didymella rabiei TaxID=5454 RepID=A0A162WAZ1_DIDRA|nr:hypothetical protein ST47_g9949 [Ascochyta rabiei]